MQCLLYEIGRLAYAVERPNAIVVSPCHWHRGRVMTRDSLMLKIRIEMTPGPTKGQLLTLVPFRTKGPLSNRLSLPSGRFGVLCTSVATSPLDYCLPMWRGT